MHGSAKVLDFFNSSNLPDFSHSCYDPTRTANSDCPEEMYSANVFTQKAIDVIRAVAPGADVNNADRQPFFLYLAYQSVHSPDEAPERLISRFNSSVSNSHRRTFAGMVTALDDGVGNVTAVLKELHLDSSTLIIFTTDNGGPADNFNSNMASNWPLRGMKRTLWEGGTRGVGFMHGAGLPVQQRILDGFIHATDWMPTILSAARTGTGIESQFEFDPPFLLGDGVDQWGYLSGKVQASPRTEIMYEAHPEGSTDGNGNALRVGQYKILMRSGSQWSTGSAIHSNDGWYGGPGSSDPNTDSYAVDAADVAKLTVKCPPPPANYSAAFPCVQNDDKTHFCLFDLDADPCEHHDISTSQPAILQKLVERLKDYQKTAVESKDDPHRNPDPGCPKTVANVGPDNQGTMFVCPDPGMLFSFFFFCFSVFLFPGVLSSLLMLLAILLFFCYCFCRCFRRLLRSFHFSCLCVLYHGCKGPTPPPTPPAPTPPTPAPTPAQTFTLTVEGSSPPLCLAKQAGGVSIVPCTGSANSASSASSGSSDTSSTLWSTHDDGQAAGGIESAAKGSTPTDACLKIFESPASDKCKGWDTLHMGKCSNAQENAFKLVPKANNGAASAPAFQLQSVQCPSRCIGTASSDSDSVSSHVAAQKATLTDCSSSTAGWVKQVVELV
jgi:hypothetical protein